jgi:hypothetical protein
MRLSIGRYEVPVVTSRYVVATGAKSSGDRERPPRPVCLRRVHRCVQQQVHAISDQLGN